MSMKRILSSLLALVLLLGAVPVNAFASEAEMPVVLEEPAVLTPETEPVLVIPEIPEEETTEAAQETEALEDLSHLSVPYAPAERETAVITETHYTISELEPGVYGMTTEERTQEYQLPMKPLVVAGTGDASTASIDQDGSVYYFDTFAELQTLAKGSYTEYVTFCYRGTQPLVISKNLTLPQNAHLDAMSAKITVSQGITFRAGHVTSASVLELKGTMYAGRVDIAKKLNVTGSLYMQDNVEFQPGAVMEGESRVVFQNSWGDFRWYRVLRTMTDMTNAISEAKANSTKRYSYLLLPNGDFAISKSVTLPANCLLETINADSLTINAGCILTVQNYFAINCPVTVKGTLKNNGEISLYYDYNRKNTLTFASGASYSGTGPLIVFYGNDPTDLVTGLNMANIEVNERNPGSHYWELRYVKGLTKLAKPTELKWNTYYNMQWNDAAQDYTYTPTTWNGGVSFNPNTPAPYNGDAFIYKAGVTDHRWGFSYGMGEGDMTKYIFSDWFAICDPDSGTYHFTAQNYGDYVTTRSSDLAKSANWTYVKPALTLGKCTNLGWKAGQATFTPPVNNGYARDQGYQIQFYYSATKDGVPEQFYSIWGHGANGPDYALTEEVTMSRGAGYYYYKIRALSSDITKSCNGIWSDLSPALYYNGRPSLEVSNRADGTPLLNWTAVDNATNYKVYRSTQRLSGYTLLKTTTAKSMANLNAVMGKEYYYKVSAVVNGVETVCSDPVWGRRTLPKAVVTLSCNVTSGKPVLKWKAVPGATGYAVLYSTQETGYYTWLKDTTGLTYTHTDAVPGTRYYYMVLAFNDTNPNAYSETVPKSIVCDLARPTGLKVTNDAATGKNKVSWNKVTGASKYQVWYSTTGKDGSFKLLYTTKALTFTHQKSEPGKMYYYKVKAIHTNTAANSALTGSYKRTADLARPVVTAGNNATTGKVRLTWKAVTGARKYQVWFSETGKTGSFKLVWTCKNLYFNHNASKVGVTGYYKVMAIHTNTAANSAYSTVVSRAAK